MFLGKPKVFWPLANDLLAIFDITFHMVQTSGLMSGSKMHHQDTAADIISMWKGACYQSMNIWYKCKEQGSKLNWKKFSHRLRPSAMFSGQLHMEAETQWGAIWVKAHEINSSVYQTAWIYAWRDPLVLSLSILQNYWHIMTTSENDQET